jgi:hypothetical protein
LVAINKMMRTLSLDWDESRLGELRCQARKLVVRSGPRIRAVAGELIQYGCLTAAQIERIG